MSGLGVVLALVVHAVLAVATLGLSVVAVVPAVIVGLALARSRGRTAANALNWTLWLGYLGLLPLLLAPPVRAAAGPARAGEGEAKA